jgi:hypothetical protein
MRDSEGRWRCVFETCTSHHAAPFASAKGVRQHLSQTHGIRRRHGLRIAALYRFWLQ